MAYCAHAITMRYHLPITPEIIGGIDEILTTAALLRQRLYADAHAAGFTEAAKDRHMRRWNIVCRGEDRRLANYIASVKAA